MRPGGFCFPLTSFRGQTAFFSASSLQLVFPNLNSLNKITPTPTPPFNYLIFPLFRLFTVPPPPTPSIIRVFYGAREKPPTPFVVIFNFLLSFCFPSSQASPMYPSVLSNTYPSMCPDVLPPSADFPPNWVFYHCHSLTNLFIPPRFPHYLSPHCNLKSRRLNLIPPSHPFHPHQSQRDFPCSFFAHRCFFQQFPPTGSKHFSPPLFFKYDPPFEVFSHLC